MKDQYFQTIAKELSIHPLQVMSTSQLLDEGSTVPFIARYRKEKTGELDEVKIQAIRDRLEQFVELDKRRDSIIKSLTERELLTDELDTAIQNADNLKQLEDIYLPYKPKKRTKATIAREKGLEPLAKKLFEQSVTLDPENEARQFINEDKKVKTTDDALTGARHIIAEWINENADVRNSLRYIFTTDGVISSKVIKDKEEAGAKFKDYFDWQEPLPKAAGHRIMAIFRGEKEGILKVVIKPDEDKAIRSISKFFRKEFCPAWEQVKSAIEDAYKRLLSSSIENEIRSELKEKADDEAINVFSLNLRELLMAAPLGQKAVMAIDPGFRTGCKTVCLDPQGKFLFQTVLHLTQSQKLKDEAENIVKALCQKFNIQAIAIGNGTASRETEAFIKKSCVKR